MADDRTDRALTGWNFHQEPPYGCWRGTHADGRRTRLKASLAGANQDAATDRVVCRAYPWCPHTYDSQCERAARQERYRRGS